MPVAKVLFIDDDPTFTSAMREGLSEAQHVVDYASSLEVAEERLFGEGRQYDVIILDLALRVSDMIGSEWRTTAEMPGWLFGKRVRAQRSKVPIVYISNFADRIAEMRAQFGANDFGVPKMSQSLKSFNELIESVMKRSKRG